MRVVLLVGFCLFLTGCMRKTDLAPLPAITRVAILEHELERGDLYPPYVASDKVPALVTLIDCQRRDWTRAIGVGFGPPGPAYYAHLYAGDTYLGYFAVGASVLPGSSAFFQVQYAGIYAQKRVTRSEANRFLDLIGRGGNLSDNMDNEVRRQVANRPPTSLASGLMKPSAKFEPGDSVRVKTTQIEGKVCLRTRLFRENRYWVTLPDNYYVFFPIREREERAATDAEYARMYGTWGPKPWHSEGPFYESELEHAR